MLLDQFSLLTAIALSCAALSATLYATWLGKRSDRYLLAWSVALAFIAGSVVALNLNAVYFSASGLLVSFLLMIAGFGFLLAGAMLFRSSVANWRVVAGATILSLVATTIPFAFGYSGIGTAMANAGIALLLGLAAWQYWAGRSEAPVAMYANAGFYGVTGLSFLLCAIVPLYQRTFVLDGLPSNWAEDVNGVVIIIGLTGVGALSLALSHIRMARLHRQEAMSDALTGLFNRRALTGRFGTEPMRPGTAVLMLDIDHFKAVNDTHGHAVGDEVLRRFAEIMLANIRLTDFAARVGGEEFCLVLPNSSQKAAVEVAERIRAQLQQNPVSTEADDISVTVSVGVAISAHANDHFDALAIRADAALYAAKAQGRNKVCSSGIRLVA